MKKIDKKDFETYLTNKYGKKINSIKVLLSKKPYINFDGEAASKYSNYEKEYFDFNEENILFHRGGIWNKETRRGKTDSLAGSSFIIFEKNGIVYKNFSEFDEDDSDVDDFRISQAENHIFRIDSISTENMSYEEIFSKIGLYDILFKFMSNEEKEKVIKFFFK